MKKLLMVIPLVILLCFTVGCQQGEEVAEEVGVVGLTEEDVVAIKAAHDSFVQAVMTGGWGAVIEFYSEDAVFMPPNAPMIQGREALKAFNKMNPPVTAFNLTVEDIDGRDDLAYVRGTASMTMEAEGAPEPTQATSMFLQILRKQEDGSWLISVDIINSDLPLPPPPKKE